MEIAGHDYAIGKIDAFAQFHVARRLAPAILAMGHSALALLKGDGSKDDQAFQLETLMPLVNAIAGMTNDDSEFVLNTCLSACTRKQAGGWAKVFIPGGGLAFADIDMLVMMRLVLAVIRENLSNFTAAVPTPAPATGAA